MSNSNSNTTSGGISFCGLLTIAFIVLKLIDKIDWSWWWVLSPLWIPFCLVFGFIILAFIISLLAGMFCSKKKDPWAGYFNKQKRGR